VRIQQDCVGNGLSLAESRREAIRPTPRSSPGTKTRPGALFSSVSTPETAGRAKKSLTLWSRRPTNRAASTTHARAWKQCRLRSTSTRKKRRGCLPQAKWGGDRHRVAPHAWVRRAFQRL